MPYATISVLDPSHHPTVVKTDGRRTPTTQPGPLGLYYRCRPCQPQSAGGVLAIHRPPVPATFRCSARSFPTAGASRPPILPLPATVQCCRHFSTLSAIAAASRHRLPPPPLSVTVRLHASASAHRRSLRHTHPLQPLRSVLQPQQLHLHHRVRYPPEPPPPPQLPISPSFPLSGPLSRWGAGSG